MRTLGSCSSGRVTSTWKAQDVAVKKYAMIMVVGFVREADRSIREKMENHLVADFKALGFPASSAFSQFRPRSLQNLSGKQISRQLRRAGVDAVLTIMLLYKRKERRYIPAGLIHSPFFVYHSRFLGFHRSVYSRIEMPGYYEATGRYFWENDLYDLVSEKLAYSVQTQSFDTASTDAVAHEYGKKSFQVWLMKVC